MGRLFFNTGVCWLGGFLGGGGFGFVEGWRGAANPNMKIRFNSVMNAMSRRGSIAGNSLGIIGEYDQCGGSVKLLVSLSSTPHRRSTSFLLPQHACVQHSITHSW